MTLFYKNLFAVAETARDIDALSPAFVIIGNESTLLRVLTYIKTRTSEANGQNSSKWTMGQ